MRFELGDGTFGPAARYEEEDERRRAFWGECPEVQPGRFAVRFPDDLPDAVAC